MVDVNVEPFEIELATRRGVKLRADVYLPKGGNGPYPTLFAASPYQKLSSRQGASLASSPARAAALSGKEILPWPKWI
ncbi:MAG TPA: CocE/NonD family hydrolase [Stellaceae bacterium]|nr:CocE/NonD family hydrolase [Stellaceae bacterium]